MNTKLANKQLKSKVKTGKKIFAVYGLGNVGGPIAAAWLNKGARLIGVDISKDLINNIKNGTSHKNEPFISDIFSRALKKGKLSLTSDGISASKDSDIKIVAVPVDLNGKKINLKALIAATTSISKALKRNDAVIITSSLPPGTTKKIVLPLLEKNSGLKGERDFFLIYNPERIFEGRALADIENNYPAIVSGLGKKSIEFGNELLKIISKNGTLKISTIETAEAEKLFEGVYRDVNIALANELATFSELVGVDFWEARKGANSQPYCHLHHPGTGVGGLCIPVYPLFVIQTSSKAGKQLRLLENSRKINDFMPKKCVSDAISLLKNQKILKRNSKIAVLGLGFRGDVTDSRLSPTYTVINEFLKKGFQVVVHDPYILEDDKLPSKVTLTNNLSKVTQNASLIFISSEHKMYTKLSAKSITNSKKPLLIYDGRNILDKKKFKNSLVRTIGKQ